MDRNDRIALFPLSTVLFPGQLLRLHIFEQRYRDLMRDRADAEPIFGVVLTRSGWEVGEQPEIHSVGTAASLEAAIQHDDGRYSIAVRGTRRFQVGTGDWSRGYLVADIEWLEDADATSDAAQAASVRAGDAFAAYAVALAAALAQDTSELASSLERALAPQPGARSFQIAAQLPLNTWELQQILEIDGAAKRLDAIARLLERERRHVAVAGAVTAPDAPARIAFSPN